jgi:undecaprenyl-diphosphatase
MWPFAEMRAFARIRGRMKAQPMVSRGRDTGNGFEVQETANERQPPLYLQRVFAQVDPFELRLLRRFALYRSRPAALKLALVVNRLGDGWIYPILALVVLAYPGWIPIKVVLTALLAAGLAHVVYPLIKTYMARPRPFEKDLTLIVAAAPLDKYSCPSGHVMTATAVFLPFALASLPLGLGLLVVWCLFAWARIVLAHHYASDLVAGVAVGAASATVSSRLLIPSLFALLGLT